MKRKDVGFAFQTLDTNVLETSIVPDIAMSTFTESIYSIYIMQFKLSIVIIM